MYTLQGQYNECTIFTDTYDSSMIGQLYAILNQSSVKDSVIRIMPDCHAGSSCVIGTTMTIIDHVIPNLVGADIGCGMTAVKIKAKRAIELEKLDSFIRQNIPSGKAIYPTVMFKDEDLKDLIARVNIEEAERYLGSLGGGNHFIELDKDQEGSYWLVVHSGSRKLGTVINKIYQDRAYESLKEDRAQATLEELLANKSPKEISQIKNDFNRPLAVPYELAYVTGADFEHYLHDVLIVQAFASLNRQAIIAPILKAMKWEAIDTIETVHNYIGQLSDGTYVVRKGAVSAQSGEKIIIPMNMRDGILVCVGKGNKEWNESAPHGAGRALSRKDAKETISMTDYKNSMKGIYSSSVSKATIDESPMAYKPMDEILSHITDTVDVLEVIKPVYNFKAGSLD